MITNKQKWAIIILSFTLALTLIISGYAYGSLKTVERILSSPAVTSKIDIDADMMLTASKDGKLELEYIHLNRIQGELNSKILDLILLAIND